MGDSTLKVLSPQMESVILRKSPSSPARNRSVRSDFLTNLVDQASVETAEPLKLDIPISDIGRPPLPKTSPPKFTGIAKALSPQPYNKPPTFDAQNKIAKNKYSRHSSERISFSAERSHRDSPSPKLAKVDRSSSVEPIPSLIIKETVPVESSNYNLNKSCVAELYPKDTIVSTLQRQNDATNPPCQFDLESSTEPELSSSVVSNMSAVDTVTQSLRNQSLSPIQMDSADLESEQECHSLPIEDAHEEMVLPLLEDGRRSTQGIPEVERNVKFSNQNPFQNKLTDSTQLNNKNIFKANPVEVVTENKVNSGGQIEDNVNVKERASIFGQRKISESKVRMISAQPEKLVSDSVTKQKLSVSNNPTSPSKIKNMA